MLHVNVQKYLTNLLHFGSKNQYCTGHNYNMIQISVVIAGAEVKKQCRDQIESRSVLGVQKCKQLKLKLYLRAEPK